MYGLSNGNLSLFTTKFIEKHKETWAWQQEDNEKWKKNMEKSI